jgi:hypothetical protein
MRRVHRRAVLRERVEPDALDEERAPLLEELLEGREVHHRRVGLDLAEVGVDGGVHREVGGEAVLEVRA